MSDKNLDIATLSEEQLYGLVERLQAKDKKSEKRIKELETALKQILGLNTNWDAETVSNYIDQSQKIAKQVPEGSENKELKGT